MSARIYRKKCVQKNCVWNCTKCTYKYGKYLESIIGDFVSTCDEIKVVTKTVSRKTATKKTVTRNFYILLTFLLIINLLLINLLITIGLLIAVSIYGYLAKYQAKQKHLIPCYDASNK